MDFPGERRAAGIAEKSDDFTQCRITYFQFNLPSSANDRRRPIERRTIILPRTNEEGAGGRSDDGGTEKVTE